MIINYQRLQEVKELYEQGNRTKQFFMNKYNISNKTVQRIFKKLGFIAEHKQHTKYRLSYDLAITDYKNGMSIVPIAKKYGLTVSVLRNYFKKLNIYKNEKPRYVANYNFFENIDTERKAYWLGFIYADGCVKNKNSLTIGIHKKDIELLIQFKKDIEASHLFSYDKRNQVRITISNDKLYSDLNKAGVVPRKTKILTFPDVNILPFDLRPHFIRGYFDGDGCICIHKKSKIVSFVGTENFLIEIRNIFHKELKLTKTKFYVRRPETPIIKNIVWSGNTNAKKIFNYLYKDANIFLNRKYQKFLLQNE